MKKKAGGKATPNEAKAAVKKNTKPMPAKKVSPTKKKG